MGLFVQRSSLVRPWGQSLALMAVGFLMVWGSGVAIAQTPRPLSLRSDVTAVQPMTGLVLWTDHERAATDAITLEFRYVGYNEVVRPDGTYDKSVIESALNEVAARKHQAILRFYFVYPGRETTVPGSIKALADYQEMVGKSEGKTTHFCDWSHQKLQNFTLEFYTWFAKHYDHDPRIAYLQTGFGLWAEYHIYDGPAKLGKTFPDKTFQARFLRHLDQVFTDLPWMISIDSADEDWTPLADDATLRALLWGVFDDSFLCKEHPKVNRKNWQTLGLDRWKRAPAGGELSYYTSRDQRQALAPSGPYGVRFETLAADYHLSFIIGSDQPSYQPMARIAEAGKTLGYRFRVTEASTLGSTILLTVTNEGIAPLYRDAFFATDVGRSEVSLKGLLPGQSRPVTLEIGSVAADEALGSLRIESDSLVEGQRIEFAADLPGRR